MTLHEPTFSNRLLWPFARLLGRDPRGPVLLRQIGLSPDELVLDQRISCNVALSALEQAARAFGDPALGLRAGAYTDEGTFGVLERAASTACDLRAAIEVLSRHLRVMNEGAEVWLDAKGPHAHIHYAPLLPHPRAANDLVVTSLLAFMRRHCAEAVAIREVWLIHDKPRDADVYGQFIHAPVRFSMPTNTLVVEPVALNTPMRSASPVMAAAFERQALDASRALRRNDTLAHRVRVRLVAQLENGAIDMNSIAKALRHSTPTLRRRLLEEGVSFTQILESVREEAARRYLLNTQMTVTEIARFLGFSHVRAFTRAFQRWTTQTPSEFRQCGSRNQALNHDL